MWGQAKGQPSRVDKPADAKTTQSQGDQRGTKDAPIVVQIQSPQSEADAAKAEKDNKRKETVDFITACSAGLAALFTGLLVIVGWCGVRAAIRTLRAIETQATQMKRQAALMEIPFEQWVNVANWESKRPTDNRFHVGVDIVNPTGLPMTLNESSSLSFSRIVDGKTLSFKYLIGRAFLSPNVPLAMNIDIQITDAELERGSLSFSVRAAFAHFDKITHKEIVRNPVGSLYCGPWQFDKKWHTVFTPFARMDPEVQTEEKQSSEGKKAN
jgi:hypothetical protein